jgi:Acetyltransferase (GNAT) domain
MQPFDPLDPTGHSRWDTDAATAPGIDAWCSRPTWTTAVHHAFATDTDPGPPLGLYSELGLASFAQLQADDGSTVLAPLDRVWGFGANIVPSEHTSLEELTNDTAAALLAVPDWKICVLAGTIEDSALDAATISAFGRHLPLYAGEERTRCQASLAGGIDGYLSRRTREHRRNIRQAERRATKAGVTFTVADNVDSTKTIARLHAIEATSWKGIDGSGIEAPEMAALYERLVRDLNARNALRCVFAQTDEGDVGFILGGVLGNTYRGLQISFTESARELSVGNLLQWHEVQRMCAEGLHTYDLGMDIDYKRRWAENHMTTRAIIAVRR